MTIAQGHGAAEVVIYFPPQTRTGRLSELVRNRSRKPASLCGLGVRIAHLPPIAHLREHVALSDCRSTVEHLTFNQGIAGSTPVSPTILENSVGQTLRQLHPRPPLHICDAGGNLDVIYYAAERKSYGTREDKKAGGDAEAAAREGWHAAAAGEMRREEER